MSGTTLAVEAKGVCVTYGRGKKKVWALQGVDLSIPEGAIYGLLGPSGCGKTSLLRCVVGRITPAEGEIRVFGTQPNSLNSRVPGSGVGYMPQDLALYQEFSIAETLTYFGRLFRMDAATIRERTSFLLKFLDLPEQSRLIQNLSGGQSRRVSLAAALIHNPPLLILDEPTVGVDPLLRESIWDYLVTLATREGMTVIITTHYIEEARKAHMVGLMRNGRILAENSPNRLIETYGLSSLEEVFLKLCKADNDADLNVLTRAAADQGIKNALAIERTNSVNNAEANWSTRTETTWSDSYTSACTEIISSATERLCSTEKKDVINDTVELTPTKSQPCLEPYGVRLKGGMARTMAMFFKNMIRLKRNLPLLIFQFLVPTLQVVLFCLCIGRDPFDLQVGIYDAEPSSSSLEFGKKFLDNLADGNTIIQKNYSSKEDAINSVYRGDSWAALTIPPNFSNYLMQRFLQGASASNDTITGSTIKVYPDMTNEQIGYVIQKVLLQAYQAFTASLLGQFGMNPAIANPIVEMEKPIYGDANPSFTEYMAPGVILSITYQMALGLTALSFVLERKEGLLDRSWVAGVTASEVLFSHVMTQLLVIVVQVTLLLVFTFLVFNIPSRGPLILVILLTLLQGICGMSYGFLISSFCREERTAIITALGTFYPNMLLSGIVWPVEAMPYYLRYISVVLPQTLACKALRSVLSRGWNITHTEVWEAYLVTLTWIFVFLLIAVLIFRQKK